MVVCKCRKATKLYCFVHKVPLCGECICFPEHQICVVCTYSEWVINGEYDWPPKCCSCQAVFEAGNDSSTTRLGCLHVMHASCLLSHIKSFPPHTAPTGYVCPACSSPIWPPKSVKDSGSRFHSKLREAIVQTGMEKNVFGNHLFSVPPTESHAPPAFSLDPLVHARSAEGKDRSDTNLSPSMKDPSLASSSAGKERGYLPEGHLGAKLTSPDIVEMEGPRSLGNQFKSDPETCYTKSVSPNGPGATTRKVLYHLDRQNSEISYYADEEDGNQKKYTRRGPFHHKFLRLLLPFWSNALPILPLTGPPRKDGASTDDVPEGRLRHQKSSRMDPRKILLVVALMACMATMGILYYRLAQRSLIDNWPEHERQ